MSKDMERRDFGHLQPAYDLGWDCYLRGLSKVERDVEVMRAFGNNDAYFDVAVEGYYDAEESKAEGAQQ